MKDEKKEGNKNMKMNGKKKEGPREDSAEGKMMICRSFEQGNHARTCYSLQTLMISDHIIKQV